eukprot:c45544_g1_i1 orf=66-227(+)
MTTTPEAWNHPGVASDSAFMHRLLLKVGKIAHSGNKIQRERMENLHVGVVSFN